MTRAVNNRVITPERTETPIVINGDMAIAQRGTSQTGQTGNHFPVDRFGFQMDTFGTWTSSQSTDVPTGQGFAKSLKLDCTTADASLGAGHFGFISHRFEGQNLQLLKKGTSNAEKVTISFWVKSNKTGNYVTELFDVDNTRQISQLYSISSADTWEQKVMTFAADTTGALGDDNGHSLAIHWVLGAGSTYSSGTLNTSWAANNNANRWVGGPNLADSTDNEWYMTGLQLEIGDFNADTIPPFQFEDTGTSLARCQRYFISHAIADGTRLGDGIFRSTTRVVGNVDNTGLLHNMRTTPSVATTITSFQVYHGADTTTNSAATSGTGFAMSGTHEVRTDFTFSSGSTTAGYPGKLRANSAGAMQYDAEL